MTSITLTRRHWKHLNLLLWILAFCLAAWTLRQLPLAEIAARLGRLTLRDILPWVLVNFTILYLAVWRWQLLARALETPLSVTRLFRLRQAGSAVSFVTPGPHFGGEPLQLYWLHRLCRIPLHRAVAVLGLDRFLETGTNLSVLLVGVLLLLYTANSPESEWLQIAAILSSAIAALLIAAALIVSHPAWLAERFRQLAQRWQSDTRPYRHEAGWVALIDLVRKTLTGQRLRLGVALLLALIGWGALVLELIMLLRFFELSPGYHGIVLILVGMRLAMLLPLPGGIGTIEASLLWSFSVLELPIPAAAGLIALMRVRDAVILLIGLGCLYSLQRPLALTR